MARPQVKHVRLGEIEGERAAPPFARTLTHVVAPWTLGSKHLWVGMSEIDPGSGSNPHRHDNEEVFVVLSGNGRACVGDAETPIGPESVVLVPSGVLHRLVNTGDETLRVLCAAAPPFDRELFDDRHLLEGDA